MGCLADGVLRDVPSQLFIGGRWLDGSSKRTLTVEDPATGQTLTEVADADPADGLAALEAADNAAETWQHTPPRARSDILRRVYELMMAQAEQLALLLTLEMGKPLAESAAEISYAASFLRWYSEEAVRISGRAGISEDGESRLLCLSEPVGLCVFVTPWNFPLAMGTRKIGPALAAGCTCVVKPAKQTPLSMLALARIFQEAGLPDGVINVVCAEDPGSVVGPMIADVRTRKLSFTGSTEVGKALIRRSADQVLRVSMELGGNAPFLVLPDADLDAAVEGAILAKMRNGGEACTAANRFLVHETVAEQFARRLADRLEAMRWGHGTHPGVEVGPLIDEAQRTKVADLVADALNKGATIRSGGSTIHGPGYFYRPTVLTEVPDNAHLLAQEIFGPVAPIGVFADEDEAIRRANRSDYGLAAYVYTRDLSCALRIVDSLEVGMIGLNRGVLAHAGAPFGGVKRSGFGREGGPEGIMEYLETKYVSMPA